MRVSFMWLFAIYGCVLSTVGASAAPAHEKHVIIVTIDGFAAYMLENPAASLPTLRKLAAEGVQGQGMVVVNPSVTWPNHTALITGVRSDKHSVLFNGVLTRGEAGRPVKVEPAKDQSDLVAVPTIFEAAHAAGLRTAGINWPCTRGSQSIDDNFPDVPEQIKFMTPRLREELITAKVLPDATDKSFAALSPPARDQVWSSAASHVIKARKPNFMTYHLLNTDALHHKYGPGTPAGTTGLALADMFLRDLLTALGDAKILDQTTLFIVADHGFESATKQIAPNVLFRKEGLLTLGPTTAILKARAQAIIEGGTALVYLTDPTTRDADRAKVIELLKSHEGMETILTPEQYGEYHLPTPKQSPQGPDLVLVAKPGYAFSGLATGDESLIAPATTTGDKGISGHHGYLHTNPKMNAVFVAWGAGIKKGSKIGLINNVDVPVTAAHLLGLEIKNADGKVLKEILE